MLVYRSAWLKRYHPGVFYTALLNHQPMGFWSPAVLVNDARRHHIQVLPVDIHRSQGRFHWDGQVLRLGLNYVKGFGEHRIQQVLEAREKQPFRDLHDLCQRTQLPRRLMEYLILAGRGARWLETRPPGAVVGAGHNFLR
ncbi:MAG: hypothetical protein K8L99_19030 [Anaerolineae bacterium]|nr:hypothetical protein [Anaerolineae bacterium]